MWGRVEQSEVRWRSVAAVAVCGVFKDCGLQQAWGFIQIENTTDCDKSMCGSVKHSLLPKAHEGA